ncbi:hemerythrin HHE cation binding domain-containing protein [Nitrosomonas oligotropha]|uniref:Hemerythrin HHE cation binding domain-containing protein n=1 Tax=Nitrosomonas oligotropha TaxID=42354 RepID=A0A2T5I026_9PROT|nr:hemerythrin domain-containing protein [Nitrosomonas oligotropha]PTQ77197.1 hemerythrin HHE cation binding domain-containing protein [Nitrosomonas oligotropha]
MPRTGALLSLSREHHSSLVLARAIRQAAESGDNEAFLAMMQRIEEHWRTVLCEHFAREEQLLRLAADGVDAESTDRILIEHEELRMLACGPCELDLPARLRRFGELLGAHVRYEERVLFPQLQSHPSIDSAAAEST